MNSITSTSNGFEHGEYVRLTDGYFQNYIGPIREMSSDESTAVVALTIFKREHLVSSELKHLVPASSQDGHYFDPEQQ